jgi:hypothetical protein
MALTSGLWRPLNFHVHGFELELFEGRGEFQQQAS